MPKAQYIDYKKLNNFYTIKEASKLLHTTRPKLKRLCSEHEIWLHRNANNEYGLTKASFAKLHYCIYHEYHDGRPN